MLTCSFCGKSADKTNALLAGPDVNICDECIAVGQRAIETRDALEQPLPTESELHASEDEVLLSQAAATADLVDRSRERLQLQVMELRRREVDWGVISTSLGLSRQATQERFG